MIKAERVKIKGATGAYTSDFEAMEDMLREINNILSSAVVSNDELVAVQTDIDRISGVLNQTTTKLNGLDSDLATIKSSIAQGKSNMAYLKTDAQNLERESVDMKDEITALQETNVGGALDLTREAHDKSLKAADKIATIYQPGGDLLKAEIQREATENLMER